jgi:hypothetical protein
VHMPLHVVSDRMLLSTAHFDTAADMSNSFRGEKWWPLLRGPKGNRSAHDISASKLNASQASHVVQACHVRME